MTRWGKEWRADHQVQGVIVKWRESSWGHRAGAYPINWPTRQYFLLTNRYFIAESAHSFRSLKFRSSDRAHGSTYDLHWLSAKIAICQQENIAYQQKRIMAILIMAILPSPLHLDLQFTMSPNNWSTPCISHQMLALIYLPYLKTQDALCLALISIVWLKDLSKVSLLPYRYGDWVCEQSGRCQIISNCWLISHILFV